MLAFILTFSVATVSAQSGGKKTTAGQDVTVSAETAIVYDKANFDASAIAYLPAGEQVRVSKKVYGKIQKFYKVRLQNGKFGYISTIDVQAGKKSASKSAKANSAKPLSDKERDQISRARVKRELAKPMMYNKWFGVSVGSVSFREKIEGTHGKAQLLTYGLKITGPDVLLQGPIMDINLVAHFGAPDYYKDISLTQATGFLFFGDAMILIPFGLGTDSGLYAGLGPMFKYSSFKSISNAGEPRDSSDFGIGGSFAAGVAYRFGAFSARVEGKYYVESLTHAQIQLGIQTLY